MTRELTIAQISRLEKLADEEEGTRVVGWSQDGPVIRRQRNGAERFDYAAFRRIEPFGHLMPISREALAEAGLLGDHLANWVEGVFG